MELPSKDKPYESWRSVRDSSDIRNSVLKVLKALLAPLDKIDDPAEDGANYEGQLKSWIQETKETAVAFQFE